LGVPGTGLSYQTSLEGEQTRPDLSLAQEAVRDAANVRDAAKESARKRREEIAARLHMS
jgi:hypothetical protein